MKRLAIITTHPIQYYAPVFKLLAERKKIIIKVFYTWGDKGKGEVYDPGFGKVREWDIPLLEGYDYEFVINTSKKPGSAHFWGINNPGLIDKIVTWKAEAVLVIGWRFISHLKVMFHFKGKIPVLFRGDSTLLDELPGLSIKKLIRRLSLSFVYRNIDYALYVGTNNKAYYLASGIPISKLIFAPHAIDNKRFRGDNIGFEEEVRQLKTALKIPLHKPAILFAGKLEAKKNPLFFVEAARRFPDIHFIIVGNGALDKIIEEQASGSANLTLLPFQNQSKMPLVYRLADIFVLPSKGPGETWGLAINEAMASGRMIIASNKCGGAIDLVKDGQNGFIIEPLYQSFSVALQNLVKMQSEWATMKSKSLLFIRGYSLENLATSLENKINTL